MIVSTSWMQRPKELILFTSSLHEMSNTTTTTTSVFFLNKAYKISHIPSANPISIKWIRPSAMENSHWKILFKPNTNPWIALKKVSRIWVYVKHESLYRFHIKLHTEETHTFKPQTLRRKQGLFSRAYWPLWLYYVYSDSTYSKGILNTKCPHFLFSFTNWTMFVSMS
jgi:hypothetical protein